MPCCDALIEKLLFVADMKTLEFQQFVAQLEDAYEHIYDLVYLRTHPVINLALGGKQATTKESAWQLHHTLLKAVQELNPGPQAPAFSREWRRHRLMVLRYVDGLLPQAVADQLGISRRHYYREQEGAIQALAEILWNQFNVQERGTADAPQAAPVEGSSLSTVVDRMELIRLEAAQLGQIDRRMQLTEVMHGTLALLTEKARHNAVTIRNTLEPGLPAVWGDYRLIRQLLLGLIGHLVSNIENSVIEISAALEGQQVIASLTVESAVVLTGSQEVALSGFRELAALCGVDLVLINTGGLPTGFRIGLPLYTARRTILVVDDNEDVLELFKRYLKPHDYEVIATRTSSELLAAARTVQPAAIILDLMIPDQDGWDLLQILLNRLETQSTPIIICSILQQRDLALSLGATAFLEKPISEDRLLALLNLLQSGQVGDSC